MSGQAHGGGAVLPVCPRVGQGVHVQGPDDAILRGPQAHMDLHLVAGGGGDLALLPGVDHLGGAAGLPGDQGGVYLGHHRLLGSEAAADAGLLHVDLGLGDVQGVGQNAPHVEDDLGGGHHMEPAVGVHLRVGAEGLHHGLVAGLGVVHSVHHTGAVGQNLVHVAVGAGLAGAQVAPVVRPHWAQGAPVVLGVDEDGAVQGLIGVQDGLQHLVAHPDQLHGPVHRLLSLSGHDGHRVSHKAHPLVQDQPVIGGGLRVGLPRHGEPLLGHVPVGENSRDAGDLHGGAGVNLLNESVGVGAAQHLDHQAVPGGHVVHIGRLAQQKGHGVLLAHRLAHALVCLPFHVVPPHPCLLWSR